MTPAGVDPSLDEPGTRLEQSIAHLLTWGTYASIALLAIGFVLMIAGGIGPLSSAPRFDPAAIAGDLLALRPTGFLSLGLIVILATPGSRVVASLLGYARRGERRMTVVSILILLVLGVSIAAASGLEG